ncbi:hypothetical protein NDU88_003880 [Pleurodeles waltl]|uniref:Uncharacterized protein n=1 Tax=Pleurodeles waltl TaxID=8319 RepID=A0AAV7W6I5_PLEWA|nr:hypothetical protein NDU88_003880 [Pleurodeles waltl]
MVHPPAGAPGSPQAFKCQRRAQAVNLRGSAAIRRPSPGQAEFLLPALNGKPPPPMWCAAPSTLLGGRRWSSAKMARPSEGAPGSPLAPPRCAGLGTTPTKSPKIRKLRILFDEAPNFSAQVHAAANDDAEDV